MKQPKHLHSVGDFWVYYAIDYRSNLTGKIEYNWLASPKASGTYRRAAVRVSGLKGRRGSTAKRIGTRRWLVTVPHHNPGDGCTRPDEFTVCAASRAKALLLGEIHQQYHRPNSPQLTTLGRAVVAAVKVWEGTSHRWDIVLPTRRVPAPPKEAYE